MSLQLPERRWVENEVIFRAANERITKEVDATKAIADEENQEEFVDGIDDLPLLFYCECSDKNCQQRIAMTPKKYASLHRNKKQFLLIPGHDIPSIEHIVHKDDKYIVVEKSVKAPIISKE